MNKVVHKGIYGKLKLVSGKTIETCKSVCGAIGITRDMFLTRNKKSVTCKNCLKKLKAEK